MRESRIGIAIPTYGREGMLRTLVNSIPDDWPVFVSDNNASMAPLASKFPSNVTISHAPQLLAIFANWNRALSLVSKECTHVFIPSDDDLYLSNCKAVVLSAIQKNPHADVFIFGCDLVDESGKVTKGYNPKALKVFQKGEGFLKFVSGVDARMPGVLFRRQFLDEIGPFDESFTLTASDSELIQRALLLGESVFVPTVIGLYRVWNGSLTYARQASDQWISEISLWTEKITALIKVSDQRVSRRFRAKRFRDEIMARNLLAGASNLLANNKYSEAHAFFCKYQIPRHAKLRTTLRLFRKLLLTLKCKWLDKIA